MHFFSTFSPTLLSPLRVPAPLLLFRFLFPRFVVVSKTREEKQKTITKKKHTIIQHHKTEPRRMQILCKKCAVQCAYLQYQYGVLKLCFQKKDLESTEALNRYVECVHVSMYYFLVPFLVLPLNVSLHLTAFVIFHFVNIFVFVHSSTTKLFIKKLSYFSLFPLLPTWMTLTRVYLRLCCLSLLSYTVDLSVFTNISHSLCVSCIFFQLF